MTFRAWLHPPANDVEEFVPRRWLVKAVLWGILLGFWIGAAVSELGRSTAQLVWKTLA